MLGGRGGSSGIGGNSLSARISGFGSKEYGINVTAKDGAKINYIVQEFGGTTYVSRGLGANPEPFPISGKEIAKRAINNGASVTLVTPSEMKKKREAFAKELDSKPDYELGMGIPWGNAAYRRTARMNRINTRTSRRRN